MRLDMTITIGNVIQIAILGGGIFIAYSKLKEQLATIETRLGPLWSEFVDRRTHARRAEDSN